MSHLPTNPSESTKRRNPQLYGDLKKFMEHGLAAQQALDAIIKPPKPRIRQSTKPLLNQLEQEWFDNLMVMHPNYPRPHAQAMRLKIGNGAWYKGDMFATWWPQPDGPAMPTVWECKGPKQMKNVARGMLAIKSAAHQWPDIVFVLVWKQDGQWITQRVLP